MKYLLVLICLISVFLIAAVITPDMTPGGFVFKNQDQSVYFGDKENGNYTRIEADGTIVFVGSAGVWDDIRIETSNLRSGGTPPSYAAMPDGIYGVRFDDASVEEVYGNFELPHGYKENSNLEVHIHWMPSTNNTGNSNVQFLYNCAGMNGNFASTATTLSSFAKGSGDIQRHQYSQIGYINGAGKKVSDMCKFTYKRNGTASDDTGTFDMWMFDIDIHYQIDKVGSREMLNN